MSVRIAFFLPNLSGGGAERSVLTLAGQLGLLGIDIDLILASATGPYISEVENGVRLIDLEAPRVCYAIPRLVSYLRREHPDVLVSALDHTNKSAAIALCLNGHPIRFVMLQRSIVSACWTHDAGGGWLDRKIYQWSYQRADLIIGNSKAVTADLHATLGIAHDHLAVVHNAIDSEVIGKKAVESLPEAWFRLATAPFILAVGSLIPIKDFGNFVRAFAILAPCIPHSIVILGEGPERAALHELALKLGVAGRVHMPGFDRNPFRWMRRAELLVSSSLTEGCPNVIQQALACGTPIVATDCPGGTSEILEKGKWGRLIPVADPEAMADAIVATLRHSSLPDGRIRAAAFAPRSNALEYLGLILPDFMPRAKEEAR